jgi:HD-like signal output (HDOD) protein
MKAENLDVRIKHLRDLPTLPTILVKCDEMLKDPNVSCSDLAGVIRSDQAISSKILKLVNSAFYGLPGKVSTISQAIVILGFNTVRNIVLSLSVFDLLPKDADCGDFEMSKLWEHSMGCAVVSRVIGQKTRIKGPEEAFIAGLLHDIGKVVIAKLFFQDFLDIIRITHTERVLFLDAEQRVLGTAHTQIGEILATHWTLPPALTEAISLHHYAAPHVNSPRLVAITHLADIIARGLHMGSGGDPVIPEVSETAWNTLNMSSGMVGTWMGDFDEGLGKASIFSSTLAEQ